MLFKYKYISAVEKFSLFTRHLYNLYWKDVPKYSKKLSFYYDEKKFPLHAYTCSYIESTQ